VSNAGRRRIVIVEDNADAREVLRFALEVAGHEVHDAYDGPSGLAAIMIQRPDARKARAAMGSALHLIALTGYGQPDDKRQALEAGFDTHLVKPVEPEILLDAIQAARPTAATG
jgi:CheY-like chemotaxis protein